MKIKTLYLIVCCQVVVKGLPDFDSSNMLNCTLQNELSEFDQVHNLNKIKGRVIGSMIFSLYCPINMLILLFLMISSITKQQLRKSPGDICIGALLSELALVVHWFIMGIRVLTIDEPIMHESFFCQISATLGILGYIGSILYNVLFYLYLVFHIKYKAYQRKFESWATHILILITTFALTLAFFLTQQSGKNSSGWCVFIEGTYTLFVSATLLGFILLFSLFMLIYTCYKARMFKKDKKVSQQTIRKSSAHSSFQELKESSNNLSLELGMNTMFDIDVQERDTETVVEQESLLLVILRSHFFGYSNIFVMVCLLFWTLLQGLAILQLLNCWYLQSVRLMVIYTVNDILKVLYTTVLPLVRASEPKMKEMYRKSLERYFGHQEMWDNFMEVLASHIVRRRNTIIGPKILVDFLSDNEKNKVLFRILAALVVHEKHSQSLIHLRTYSVKSSNDIFRERKVYILSDSVFRKHVAGIPSSFFHLPIPSEKIRMDAFMPVVFTQLQSRYSWKLKEELRVSDNLLSLRESCLDEVSSKLIFFSQQDRILIRQISKYQMRIMLEAMKAYQKYFVENKASFIQPLCGLYTFEVTGKRSFYEWDQGLSKRKIFIAAFPSLEVNNPISVYALNGFGESNAGTSARRITLSRSTSPGKNMRLGYDGQLFSDEDFKHRERNKLSIKKEELEKLSAQLRNDATFLCSCGFTGYELMVIKQKRTSPTGKSDRSTVFVCLDDPDEEYHLMIVGYLQTYSMRKKVRSLMKKIVHLNRHHESLVQNAQSYAQRFNGMINAITSI